MIIALIVLGIIALSLLILIMIGLIIQSVFKLIGRLSGWY